MSGGRAVLYVPSTGVHVFELYMREPSFKIDKIVLTTNIDYIPEDLGPDETLVDSEVESSGATPADFVLEQNYPNPFNPTTTINYSLPTSDYVTFSIYNTAGVEVARLIDGFQTAGGHQITWNAEGFASGLYFYKLQAGNLSATKKLLLQK